MNRVLTFLISLLVLSASAQVKIEKPVQVVERVFKNYIQYSESTDSPKDKEAMEGALKELQVTEGPQDLALLLDVWMYYDPTDFPTGNLIMPIFERNRNATRTAIDKRIKKKKKWENAEGAPYTDLFKLRNRFSGVLSSEDWKSKPLSGDTLFLQEGGYMTEELRRNVERPCGYEETTLYWHFKKLDTLHIDVTIRKCQVYERGKLVKDSVNRGESVLKDFETLDLDLKMMHIVTGHRETGNWKFRKGVIEISGTQSFDGRYRLARNQDKEILLIRKRK